jgi:hypothetical protein
MLFQCRSDVVPMLFWCCFDIVSILFRYCSDVVLISLKIRQSNPNRQNQDTLLRRSQKLSVEMRKQKDCPMHLDPFTLQFVEDHHILDGTPESGQLALVSAVPTVKWIGKQARLAIFQAECTHAEAWRQLFFFLLLDC